MAKKREYEKKQSEASHTRALEATRSLSNQSHEHWISKISTSPMSHSQNKGEKWGRLFKFNKKKRKKLWG